ncbi:MAG: hypothetical protein NT091_04380 [Candidatus Falkowbacteria bacterium]|nr:hypothetical protein [Candidatus Falkowbacteria bacterium]
MSEEELIFTALAEMSTGKIAETIQTVSHYQYPLKHLPIKITPIARGYFYSKEIV